MERWQCARLQGHARPAMKLTVCRRNRKGQDRPQRSCKDRGRNKKSPGLTPGLSLAAETLLLDVQREVVDDEGGLQRAVLRADQEDLDGLSLESEHAEALLREARRLVQVGERGEGRKHRARGVADLHLEGVERGNCGRLGGVDVEPEGEGRRGGRGRDGDGLEDAVGVGRAVAVEPRLPRTGVSRLTRRVVDDGRSGRPGGRVGRAVLKARVADQLHRAGGHRQGDRGGVGDGAAGAGDGDRGSPRGCGGGHGDGHRRGAGAGGGDGGRAEGDGDAGRLTGGRERDGGVEAAGDRGRDGRVAGAARRDGDRARRRRDREVRSRDAGDGQADRGGVGDAAAGAGDGDRRGPQGGAGADGEGQRRAARAGGRDRIGAEGGGDTGRQAGGRERDGGVEAAGDRGGDRRGARIALHDRDRGRGRGDREVRGDRGARGDRDAGRGCRGAGLVAGREGGHLVEVGEAVGDVRVGERGGRAAVDDLGEAGVAALLVSEHVVDRAAGGRPGERRRVAAGGHRQGRRGRRGAAVEAGRGPGVRRAGDAVAVEGGEEGGAVRRAVRQVAVVVVRGAHGLPPAAGAAPVRGEGGAGAVAGEDDGGGV